LIDIQPARTRKALGQFIDYAGVRNHHDPHWIAPLRLSEGERLSPKKNPFFAHAAFEPFLALRNGRVAGRVLAIDDRLHNETHHDNIAAFGFFEAEDGAVARRCSSAWNRGPWRVAARTCGVRSTHRSTRARGCSSRDSRRIRW